MWVLVVVASAAGNTGLGIIEHLLLLGPLVIVPLGLALARESGPASIAQGFLGVATFLQPVAAVLVAGSFLLSPGSTAAVLVTGWVAVGGLVGLSGVSRFLAAAAPHADAACVVGGMIFLPVGAGWLFASRLGLTPLGFQEPLVLLTAVHFHYTGFAVPVIAGMTGRAIASDVPTVRPLFRLVAVGVIAGPPLIAMGFVFSPLLQVLSVVLLSASLLLLCALLIALLPRVRPRLPQVLLGISAGSLAGGMLLASGYAIGEFLGRPLVGIPQMAVYHGSLNALGFSLCGLIAWVMIGREASA